MRYFFDFTSVDCPNFKSVLKEYGIENSIEYKSTLKKFVTVDDAVKRIFSEAIYLESEKKRLSCHERLMSFLTKDDWLEGLQNSGYDYYNISATNPLMLEAISTKKALRTAFLALEQKTLCSRAYVTNNVKLNGAGFVIDTQMGLQMDELHKSGMSQVKWSTLVRHTLPFLTADDVSMLVETVQDHIKYLYHADTSIVQVSEDVIEVYEMQGEVGSCMQDKSWDRYEMYSHLTDTTIAYITYDNVLVARALLHEAHVVNNDGTTETVKLMDRIYAATNIYLITMKRWAAENGYYVKERQGSGVRVYVGPNKDRLTFDNMYIRCRQIKYCGYEEVPYMDTFNVTAIGDDKIWAGRYYHTDDKENKFIVYITSDENGYVYGLCK